MFLGPTCVSASPHGLAPEGVWVVVKPAERGSGPTPPHASCEFLGTQLSPDISFLLRRMETSSRNTHVDEVSQPMRNSSDPDSEPTKCREVGG